MIKSALTVPLLLSPTRFAREADASVQTIRRMIARGELHAVRIGSKSLRIPRAELERLLATAGAR